jgi:hypothetical protein
MTDRLAADVGVDAEAEAHWRRVAEGLQLLDSASANAARGSIRQRTHPTVP